MSKFIKATRHKVHLKLAMTGPTGSTKTFSALLLALGLANGSRIAFIDTENNSASLYADRFDFDVLSISPPFTETKFIEAIRVAVAEGYIVLIIDSFSHSWLGALDYKAGLDARGGNSFTNWNKAGAKFNELLTAILQSKIHIVCCMRSKMDYVLEPDIKGKMVPHKVGLAPVMRDGIEFEFSTIFEGDLEHYVTVTKDRTGLFTDQRFQVTEETGRKLLGWLNAMPPEPATSPAEAASSPPEPAPSPGSMTSAPARGQTTAVSQSNAAPAQSNTAVPGSSTTAPGSNAPAPQPVAAAATVQEQLAEALRGLPPDWVTGFLVDRKKITLGQSVLDAPLAYCKNALSRVLQFKAAIIKFGEQVDDIQLGVKDQPENKKASHQPADKPLEVPLDVPLET